MINLLPAPHKEELKQQERTRLVVILGVLVFLFLLSFTLLLAAIRVYIAGQLQGQEIVQESHRQNSVQQRGAAAELKKLNFDVTNVESFQQEQTSFSIVLERISVALPSEFYITSLTLVDGNLSLVGFAPTRDALLAFRSVLQKDAMFSDITIPPSVWIVAKDVRFSLEAKITMSK
ncbi:PilN domain-containing protein [Patescibacteria group bacterium]|nr:PilN domain-containing protein [Patescibacteria group bacterium]